MTNLFFPKMNQPKKSNTNIFNKAFTLIELLVVISIIGMLSSVIMVSLQGARDKGRVAAGIKFATYNNRAFGADAIAYYNFNESGTANALDGSGNSVDLTLVGNAIHGAVDSDKVGANSGSYLILDGSGDYAVRNAPLPAVIQNKSITKYTASAWVYHNSLSSYTNWVGIVSLYNPRGISLMLSSTGGLVAEHGTCSSGVDPIFGLQANKWQHVTVTYDGTKYSFYIDGKFIRVPTTSGNCSNVSVTPTSSSVLYVGYYSGGTYINGRIDDVAIYTQSLTASEIYNIYAKGAAEHGIAIK